MHIIVSLFSECSVRHLLVADSYSTSPRFIIPSTLFYHPLCSKIVTNQRGKNRLPYFITNNTLYSVTIWINSQQKKGGRMPGRQHTVQYMSCMACVCMPTNKWILYIMHLFKLSKLRIWRLLAVRISTDLHRWQNPVQYTVYVALQVYVLCCRTTWPEVWEVIGGWRIFKPHTGDLIVQATHSLYLFHHFYKSL